MARHLAKYNVPLYLRDKRERKRARRAARIAQASKLSAARSRELFAVFGKESRVIQMLAGSTAAPTNNFGGRIRFSLPDVFSIMDSPETALAALSDLAQRARADTLASVFFDFERVHQYDLGANGVLDVLVEEMETQAKRRGRRVHWMGNFPKDPANMRFIRAMGVIKRLKIRHEYPSKEDAGRLALFDVRCRHYIRMLRPREADKKTRVTKEFADHINHCLGFIGRQLTASARARLCTYVGEVIDNAEEHSGMHDWAIQGYLDTQLAVPMCEVVIFNFGRTIAQTIEELPDDAYTRKQIRPYLEMHQKRGFFRRGWRKEDLYTLIALQGNVSSKNRSERDTRGNGSVDLIEFFQRVHAECSVEEGPPARMAVLSGSTCIVFDGAYRMEESASGARVIAFNAFNDLQTKPDAKYVRQLEGVAFPGTLVSLKFPLSTVRNTVVAAEKLP